MQLGLQSLGDSSLTTVVVKDEHVELEVHFCTDLYECPPTGAFICHKDLLVLVSSFPLHYEMMKFMNIEADSNE